MDRSWRERRWGRFLLEYVGNLDIGEVDPWEAPQPADRRVNHHARELVAWLRDELAVRKLPIEKQAQLLNGVREAFGHADSPYVGPGIPEQVDRP